MKTKIYCKTQEKGVNRYIQASRITTSSIVSFAKSIDIHPGIVVGRLINEKIIHPSYYHDLRAKYQIRPNNN